MENNDCIISLLNKEVKRIQKEKKYKKNYGRTFSVSMLQEFKEDKRQNKKETTMSIILTVKLKDTGLVFSRKIFPKDNESDMICGLPSIEEEMKYLFNTTM